MIPEGWQEMQLSQLGGKSRPVLKAGPFGSAVTKGSYIASGYKVYGQQEVLSGDLNAKDYFISEQSFQKLSACAVQEGDILITMMGTVGRILEIPPGAEQGIINPRLMRISADQNRVLSGFLARRLNTTEVRRLLERRAHGGTMPGLNANSISTIRLLLPPVREQKKIVEVLETWDRAIETVEALIAGARAQKQALMQQLLPQGTTPPKKRLPGFSGEWLEVALADVLSIKRAKGKIVPTNEEGDGVPYIGSASFLGEFSNYTTSQDALICVETDILVLWDGEYAGKATTGLAGAVSSTVGRYRLAKDRADPVFIVTLMENASERIRAIREGSGVPHVPGDFEHWFRFSRPPLDEQQAIAEAFTANRTMANQLKTQLAALHQEKASLMQQLLTGKRRVKLDDDEMVA